MYLFCSRLVHSIYYNCIVMFLLLFSPSIDNLVLVVCSQFSPPRLAYKLFAGGKKCNYLFLIFNKICRCRCRCRHKADTLNDWGPNLEEDKYCGFTVYTENIKFSFDYQINFFVPAKHLLCAQVVITHKLSIRM